MRTKLLRVAAVVALALPFVLAACAGTVDDGQDAGVRHDVPALPGMMITLPRTLTVVGVAAALGPAGRASLAEEHPAVAPLLDPRVNQAMVSDAFLAVGDEGVISITAARLPAGIALDGVIDANLRSLGLLEGCTIVGPRREVERGPCGAMWDLRWRMPITYGGASLEVHNHQHVFVVGEHVVLFSLSTLGEAGQTAMGAMFEVATRSIEVGGTRPRAIV